MKKVVFLFMLALISFCTSAQSITDGTWFNEEKDGRIQFYIQADKLYGKIAWLQKPEENGKSRLDVNNPKASDAKKPLLGLVFLKGFVKDGTKAWEDGTIYDPKSGKTYSSTIDAANPDRLDVRGFVGFSFLGRTTVFTRATK
ncbi:MAG: hypothetical protein ACI9DJ_000984 [Algoriphagus sp.]|jgi:uncharacterized protein (DUF2147 family)